MILWPENSVKHDRTHRIDQALQSEPAHSNNL